MILELAADTPWRPLAQAPLIVGIGGSTHAGSTSELLLRAVLTEAARLGARTKLIAGPDAMLPLYAPNVSARDPLAHELIEALRICHGVVIASPGYHGSVSGMVKNALDYIEDLRTDTRPYLDDRAIGCIACAAGPQATGPVLAALRAIAHALRGWPTPLGIAATSYDGLFDANGVCTNDALSAQLKIVATQVFRFASSKSTPPLDAAS